MDDGGGVVRQTRWSAGKERCEETSSAGAFEGPGASRLCTRCSCLRLLRLVVSTVSSDAALSEESSVDRMEGKAGCGSPRASPSSREPPRLLGLGLRARAIGTHALMHDGVTRERWVGVATCV